MDKNWRLNELIVIFSPSIPEPYYLKTEFSPEMMSERWKKENLSNFHYATFLLPRPRAVFDLISKRPSGKHTDGIWTLSDTWHRGHCKTNIQSYRLIAMDGKGNNPPSLAAYQTFRLMN